MNTLTQRILLTVIGIPVFFSSIFFFPQAHYLFFTIICIGFSILGSYEINRIIKSSVGENTLLHPIITGIAPFSMYLQLYVFTEFQVTFIIYMAILLYLLAKEIFIGDKDNFQKSILRMATSFFQLIYPSFFVIFVIYLTSFAHADSLIIYWFLMIFSNDVFAYVFGMLLGKGSRGFLPVSPNKSLVGFAGGFCITLLNGYIFYTLVTPLQEIAPLWVFLILSACISIFANLGDLVESAMKRSSDKKDSGKIIPGRGGVLDTIDSIIFSAPIFILFLIYILKV